MEPQLPPQQPQPTIPSQPQVPLVTPQPPENQLPSNEPKRSSKKPILLIVLALVVLLVVGSILYVAMHNKKSTVASGQSGTAISHQTNTWTGSGGNPDWNNSANWSLGKPVNNQNIEINVANLKQKDELYSFVDNIPNLKINKLTFNGGAVISVVMQGDTLAISNGIYDSQTDPKGGANDLTIDNLINFTSNSVIQSSGNNVLSFYNLNIENHTIGFTVSDKSSVSVDGAIEGTGEIYVPNNAITPSINGLSFNGSSPKFNGKVVIGSGDNVVDNNNTDQATTITSKTINDFGTSSIDVMNGGTLDVMPGAPISNNITISGNGVATGQGSSSSDYFGAIDCYGLGGNGCQNETVTLTGQITLTGNTELGSTESQMSGALAPSNVTYSISKPISGSYSLTAVPGSQVTISQK